MSKRANDELIISALLQAPTIREASKQLGITEQTIYNRMNDTNFKNMYESAKRQILDLTTDYLQSLLREQIDVLRDIANDFTNPPQVRISASANLVKFGLKFREQREILERLDRIEEA